jgi:hypothetical protein
MNAYRERLVRTAPAGSFTVESKPVEYDVERYLERITVINKGAGAGNVAVYIGGYGYSHYVAYGDLVSGKPVVISQEVIFLREEEYLGFEFSGVTAGDVIEIHLTGHERFMPM